MTLTTTQLPVVAPVVDVALGVMEPRPATRSRSWSPGLPVPVRLLLLDLVAASGCVAVADLVAGAGATPALAAVPILWVLLVALSGGYRPAPGAGASPATRQLVRASAGLAVLSWAVAAAAPDLLGAGPAPTRVLLLVALTPLVSCTLRGSAGRLAVPGRPRVVVAGGGEAVTELVRELRRSAETDPTSFEPVGVCLTDDEPQTVAAVEALQDTVPVWHHIDQLDDVVAAHRPDAVIAVPGPRLDHVELRRIQIRLQQRGTDLFVATGLRDVAERRVALATAGGMRLLHVRPVPSRGPARVLKAVADRVAAAGLLTLLSPVLAVLAVAIRLDSDGPAVFRQTRVGHHGRPFTMFKLRTMCQGASRIADDLTEANESDRDGVLFKIRRDPRITRVGAFLRRYSLDEVPQLVNVVRGEMSLVGPRPALQSEVDGYSADLRHRLVVKPGMTGLWQVSGRSDLSWEDTVRLDLHYVDNWSWGLDAAIAARTAGAVLGHRGAY